MSYLKFIASLLLITTFVLAQQKSGTCPSNLQILICSPTCYSDFECLGNQKCCSTPCGGMICTNPVVNHQRAGEKYGFCPKPSGPWVCSSRCFSDNDCKGKKKCCKNRCGAMACFNPELPRISAPAL